MSLLANSCPILLLACFGLHDDGAQKYPATAAKPETSPKFYLSVTQQLNPETIQMLRATMDIGYSHMTAIILLSVLW
jgi:hypothetical protein